MIPSSCLGSRKNLENVKIRRTMTLVGRKQSITTLFSYPVNNWVVVTFRSSTSCSFLFCSVSMRTPKVMRRECFSLDERHSASFGPITRAHVS